MALPKTTAFNLLTGVYNLDRGAVLLDSEEISGLPPEVFGLLGILRVGQCISIVTSAIAAKLVIDGLTGDTMKKWMHK